MNVIDFIERLQVLIDNGKFRISGVHFSSGDIPYWVDLIIHQLTSKHKMQPKEAHLLLRLLKTSGFDKIPTLDIRTTLTANLSVKQKKELTNDHFDILRISNGLPISDIFLTDGKRKHEIIETGLDKKYKTTVLCGTENDKLIFLDLLKEINAV